MATFSGIPFSFVICASWLSSKYTLTWHKFVMKVIEVARNLMKSNRAGIGEGSRNSISNVVHNVFSVLGNEPLLA